MAILLPRGIACALVVLLSVGSVGCRGRLLGDLVDQITEPMRRSPDGGGGSAVAPPPDPPHRAPDLGGARAGPLRSPESPPVDAVDDRPPELPPVDDRPPESPPVGDRPPEPPPVDAVCGSQRNCIPKIVLSDDGHMTLSLECGGEKISMKFSVSSVYLPRANDWPEGSSPERDFSADWQRTSSLGCGVLTLDTSMASGKVQVTVFGSLSIESDGRLTLSATHGVVGLEALVEAAIVSAPAREARDALLFWQSSVKETSPVESAELAQSHVVELRAELTLNDAFAPDLAIDLTEVKEIKAGGSADAILAEWANARNSERVVGLRPGGGTAPLIVLDHAGVGVNSVGQLLSRRGGRGCPERCLNGMRSP